VHIAYTPIYLLTFFHGGKPVKKSLLLAVFLFFHILFVEGIPNAITAGANQAEYKKGTGTLITEQGYKFDYSYYPSNTSGPSVIYIPGLGGHTSWYGQNISGYTLAEDLNNAGFNFVGFDFSGWPNCPTSNLGPCVKRGQERGASGSLMMPSVDGKEAGTQNLTRNEVHSIIRFIEDSPTHDANKGIFLIGSSLGSWISLRTVHSYPDKIKGVIFLSPGIVSDMWNEPDKYPNAIEYWESMLKAFGTRPAFAIGGSKDNIVLRWSNNTAWDSAQFLRNKIGPNVDILKIETADHAEKLVSQHSDVRGQIVSWLTKHAVK
jgi:pimeloyl-ACP methyl ester carboxylesterase